LTSSEKVENGEGETDALDLGFGSLLEAEEVLLGVEAEADTGSLRERKVSGESLTVGGK
jgi:hypothetical protein